MPILNVVTDLVGQTGLEPKFVFINTNDTLVQVQADGYLNGEIAYGTPLSESNMVLVSTKATPNARFSQSTLMSITYLNGNWSLTTPPSANSFFGVISAAIDLTGAGNPIDNAVYKVNNSNAIYAITLPDPTVYKSFSVTLAADSNFFISSHCTINAVGGHYIGGVATVTFRAGECITVFSDGSNYQIIGAGTQYLLSNPMYIDNSGNMTGVGSIVSGGAVTAPNTSYAHGYTAYAGGSVTQTIAVVGMIAGDTVTATSAGSATAGAYIVSAVAGSGSLVITWSADPAASHVSWDAKH